MCDSRNSQPFVIPTSDFTHGEAVYCPFPTVTAAFYHYAASIPSSKAVRDLSGDVAKELTYHELAIRAQLLAARLRRLGVGPHQRIPLIVKRGADMVVGIMAILSCGAQYIPLDGGVVPDSTIKHVAEQCGGQIVLCISSTESRIRNLLPAMTPVVIEQSRTTDQSLKSPETWTDLATSDAGCYVIYTSGSSQLLFYERHRGVVHGYNADSCDRYHRQAKRRRCYTQERCKLGVPFSWRTRGPTGHVCRPGP